MTILTHVVRPAFYTVSYGIVFPTFLVARMVPGLAPIADGLMDTIIAACKAEKQSEDDMERMLVVEEGVEFMATC